jgi:hypothetical protein
MGMFSTQGKGSPMRQVLFVVAVGLLSSLAGCCHSSHGICDCQYDNHCADRAPWILHGPVVSQPAGEVITIPPMKLPDAKRKDL